MLIFRLVLLLALTGMFLLLGAYLGTNDKKYLTYLMNSIKYLGYFLAVMLVLFIFSQSIR